MRLNSLVIRQLSHFSPFPPWCCYLHSSTDPEVSTFKEVTDILSTVHPIEPALEPLLPFLSPRIISCVIKKQKKPQISFRFFIWASKRERLRSSKSRELIIERLSGEKGFDLYWQTLEELKNGGVPIASDAFFVLMRAYSKMGQAEKAVESFGRMQEFGCKPDVFAYNEILNLALRKKVFLLALAVYNVMLKRNCEPNVATFSMLIGGLCQNGKSQDALFVFDEMVQRGIPPNNITYTVIISGLCQASRVDDAFRLFRQMEKGDSFVHNALLDGFCKLGRVDEAFAVLRLLEKDSFVLALRGYSSLIDGLFRADRCDEACAMFREMLRNNIKPDVVVYTIVIKGLARAGKVKDALQFLRDMTDRGVVPDTICYNAVIKGFCDLGLLDEAQSLKLEISQHDCFPDTHTHTILICGMCKNGLVGEAVKIFEEMEMLGCFPSTVTFNALIDGLCKAGELDKARLLFYKMEIGRNPSLFLRLSQGGNRGLDSSTLKSMVEQYCESGMILKAYRILVQLSESGTLPDMWTYNTLIHGFCRAGNIDGAFKIVKELQLKGLSPDSVTYATLIDGLFRVGKEQEALGTFEQMVKNRCKPRRDVYNTLMTWSCRRRNLVAAFNLWMKCLQEVCGRESEEIRVIEECFKKGDMERAIQGLIEMDFKSNKFSLGHYTIFLIGLCQSGRVEDAAKIFSVLEGYRVIVTPPSCVKLIHGLCKRGHLDLAVEIFLYTLNNGFKLRPRVCNHLINSLLRSSDRKELAFDIVERMKSQGYDLDSWLHLRTKIRLYGYHESSLTKQMVSHEYHDSSTMETVSPG